MKKQQQISSQFVSGIVLVGGIAIMSMWAATRPAILHWGLSALTLAIVAGILVGNTVYPRIAPGCAAGVDFAKNRLLRLGVILFGFHITFQQIAEIGVAGVLIDVLIIACTFTLAVQLGTRLFKLDRQTAMLIGAGSSICGAAAVMATEPVVQGQAHKVSVAVATVVVFGTLGMFVYPLAFPYLHLSQTAYGVYAGSTIHEMAQVIGAAKAVSDQAAATAVIEKMLRVMMLAPFLLLLSTRMEGEQARMGKSRIVIPWFAVLFIVASGLNSLNVLPVAMVQVILQIDTVVLAMAMAALGLRTYAGAIRQAGLKPLLLGGTLYAFLMVGGYCINRIFDLLV